jgi:hypothetical protein
MDPVYALETKCMIHTRVVDVQYQTPTVINAFLAQMNAVTTQNRHVIVSQGNVDAIFHCI